VEGVFFTEKLPRPPRTPPRDRAFESLSLLRVNRQINSEAMPVLFKRNTINLHIAGETPNLGRGREIVQPKIGYPSLVSFHQTNLDKVQSQYIKLVRHWRIAFVFRKVVDNFED